MPQFCSRKSPGRANLVAACITVFSVAVLYTSFDPLPAEEDNLSLESAPSDVVIDETPVPLPPPIQVTTNEEADNRAEDAVEILTNKGVDAQITDGGLLNSQETNKFCLLLLRDGARFLENIEDYSGNFHKEERIGGDLLPRQDIAIKVQHKPHFAVYMKWQNGERGRQILYSDEYDDGYMVVKFGGFKRMLPALKIDPTSSLAKAETRYPITDAGVLGMLHQIAADRDKDVRRGHGFSCTRLSDQEFDGRNCYCFMVKYDDAEFSKIYRKNLIMVDSKLHVPLKVRNYTWANDTEGLSDQELDEITLIEDYSFTGLNFQQRLVAKEFSRENPSYRM
ncbi:MAG: DUF1571 domain-containing protein [Fuerstiella sp.]|jgi:hypothetical protein|nr:DUF1571 domain-containing protein [Fuerstiella sp.]